MASVHSRTEVGNVSLWLPLNRELRQKNGSMTLVEQRTEIERWLYGFGSHSRPKVIPF